MKHAQYAIIGSHPWTGTVLPMIDVAGLGNRIVHPEQERLHAYEIQGRFESRYAICGFEERKGVMNTTSPGDGRPMCHLCSRELVKRGWI